MRPPIPRPALPADKVSRNRKAEPKCDGRAGLLRVTSGDGVTQITCGWFKVHPRRKVREDSAERHLAKHHLGGQALWL